MFSRLKAAFYADVVLLRKMLFFVLQHDFLYRQIQSAFTSRALWGTALFFCCRPEKIFVKKYLLLFHRLTVSDGKLHADRI